MYKVVKRKKVVIYQMGKVASSSIKSSLAAINKFDITHTHHLNSSYTEELNDVKKSKGWDITISPKDVHNLRSKLFDEDELYIISLVREPVGRNIAAYFQNLDVIYGQNNIHNELSHNELLNGFLQKYPDSIPITWFDIELKQTLGIDVYKYEFPKKEGALIINEGKYKILVMRHDIDDGLKTRYLENLLSTNNLILKRGNIGAEKPYKHVYKKFIDNVSLPETYLTEMLDSKYARHFFDKCELDLLKAKWGHH